MSTKRRVDDRVSAITGIPLAKVSLVTSLFLRECTKELVATAFLQLPDFGTLTLRLGKDMTGRLRSPVFFKKERYFVRRLKETYVPRSGVLPMLSDKDK